MIPPDFAGTWKGQVVSQDDRNERRDVTITLASGQSIGRWADGDCELQATLTRIGSGNELQMSLAQQGTCPGGDMTLTLAGPGTLDLVRQEGGGSLEYRGSLRRS